jgi:hypothetical protein
VFAASAPRSFESADGGRFTQAFVKALGDGQNLDPVRGAVTLGRAFLQAAGQTLDQRPRIKGGLDPLPLAWPKPPASPHVAVASAERTTQTKEIRLRPIEARQVVGDLRELSGKLEVTVSFGHAADRVSIGLYRLADPARTPQTEIFEAGPWRRGQEQRFEVPLRGLEPGRYRVEVLPCHGDPRGDRLHQCESPWKAETDLSLRQVLIPSSATGP